MNLHSSARDPAKERLPEEDAARDADPSAPRRMIVVSNRLPVSLQMTDNSWTSQASSGGLASAVRGIGKGKGFHWVGWPGCPVPREMEADVRRSLAESQLVPVFITAEEEEGYYRDHCNQVLWPLFHYFQDKVTSAAGSWAAYQAVNTRFAEQILGLAGPDDRVWIHDFHLMLVPALLRKARPDLEIGFFLHVPWPSSEIFRLLPQREALLRGLLGADYVAFHTNDYALHFRTTCLRVLGLDSDPEGVAYENRRVGIGRHPIGIDVGYFRGIAEREETFAHRQDLRHRYQGRKVVLGVERLDYSKGIPLKLQAFERFLEADPARAQSITLLQIIVPSRLDSSDYQDLKEEIEADIGRINGMYGGPGYTPIEYIHRSVSPEQLVALYQFADVGLVTPIRDGMNLVAQEFVLCQEKGTGILILSEFAGAAQILGGSLLVNPWDVDSTARAIQTALEMAPKQRQHRMGGMVDRVVAMDSKIWANGFLDALSRAAAQRRALRNRPLLTGDAIAALKTRFDAASRRVVILDYDGTLRELQPLPNMANPTDEILATIAAIIAVPDTELHIVSGRRQSDLDTWFADLPVHLSCEHGSKYRAAGGDWQLLASYDISWMGAVEEMLERVCREVPGTMVEHKQFSLAWHYRMADLDYGLWRARELLTSLEQEVAHLGVEVISGNKVIEVRSAGVSKGNYVRHALRGLAPATFVLCFGDDRTDLDMYRALPPHAVSVHVGAAVDDAGFTIESPERVRHVLGVLTAPGGSDDPAHGTVNT